VSRTEWRRGVAVEPSIYAADFASLGAQLGSLLDAGAGVEPDALAAKLQSDGAKTFVDAWNDLIAHIDEHSAALRA
jgi:hypothetical protein